MTTARSTSTWGNYIAENPDERTICHDFIGALDYCGPGSARGRAEPLFRNLGGAVFDVSAVSRGAAFGDLDNDCDEDIVIVNSNGPARVLLNRSSPTHDWVGLRLSGGPGQRRARLIPSRRSIRLAVTAALFVMACGEWTATRRLFPGVFPLWEHLL